MTAGTLALTANGTAVTGTGTAFTTALKAGDYIITTISGVTYSLGVASITSNTALVLATGFPGPTTTGAAWDALPLNAMVRISAQWATDMARMARGFVLDKQNWQQVFSSSTAITVTLPDGSVYSGPSWQSLSASVVGKLTAASNLSDLPDKAAARANLLVNYTNSLANPGGGVVRLLRYDDSGLMIITRRFLVTAAANASTGWSYSWSSELNFNFSTYPAVSINGTGANSAGWNVKIESEGGGGVSGFIHNTNTVAISVWVTVTAIGLKV